MTDNEDPTRWNHRWFRKLITGQPHYIIGGIEDPYMIRRFIIPRNHWFNIYLHKFVRSDDDRALHDHPWEWFRSVMLVGAYTEHLPGGRRIVRFAPSIGPACAGTHTHRVELFADDDGNEIPCWTLFFTGRKVRNWGFHCPQGWRPWQQFTSKSTTLPDGRIVQAAASLGCGEPE